MDNSDSTDKECVEENPLPDAAAVEEVESSTADQLNYFIIEGSSQRQRPKLIDSNGFSYTKYNDNKDGSVTWRCRVRNSQTFCGKIVKQVGNDFYAGAKEHCHPCTPGEHLTLQVVSQVKKKATDCLFEPADQIVNEVLVDNIASGSPVSSLPDPRSLARSAKRVRKKQVPKDPTDLVFDMQHDALSQVDQQVIDTACDEEENPQTMEETTSNIPLPSPNVGTKFSTYEEVEQFIRKYEETNFVKFFKMNSRTVESSRKRLPTRFVSDHLRYATVLFGCIHHGKQRSTSKGLRPRQKTLRMGCPAKFRFSATPDGKQLYLADAVTEHSHPSNEERFRSLPQKRRLTDTEREEACHILEKKGKKSAQKHLREKTGKVLTMRDLHNLAATSKQQTQCFSSIHAILGYLSQSNDQSSTVEVVTKSDGRIVGIYYQDIEMKRFYASYPQYLIVDATCKYNSMRMPLYIMLAEDSNGENEIVGVFLVILSNTETIRSMVLRFKEHNPSWSDIQVIMADKDFTERQLLQEEFPNSSVQICLSHVLRRFKQDVSKQHLGLQKEETSFCLKLMQRLAASKSEDAYMENYTKLVNTGLQTMIDYYNNTWHSNRHEWVEGLKARSLAVKKEAVDKLESINQLLKSIFKNSPSPEQIMTNLTKVIELLREERDHSAAALLVRDPPQINPTNSTLSNFEQYTTPYAMKYILRQLKLSWKVYVKSNIDCNSSSVKSSHGKLIVYVDSCPCRFWRSLFLPCRHIFAVRRIKGLPLFADEIIGSRWSMKHFEASCRLSTQESSPDPDTLRTRRLSLLSRQEKYSHISEITQKLATAVSKAPVERYCSQVEAVKKILSLFQSGSTAMITEIQVVVDIGGSVAAVTEERIEEDATANEINIPEEHAEDGSGTNQNEILHEDNSVTFP